MNTPLLLAANEGFSVNGGLVPFSFQIGNFTVNLSETVLIQCFVTLIISVLFIILGRNLKVRPESKRQMIAEFIVTFFNKTVNDTMGTKYKAYTSYIAALFCLSCLSSLMGLLGLKAPTSDLSVVATWGIITFILVTRNKLKSGGIKGYLHSFIEPLPFMLPFNIIGEFANPLSQTIRHFANIVAGSVIGGLIYFALSSVAYGLTAIGIPAVLSLYFDIFSAVIQAYIFITLTMVYVSMAECGD